MNKKKILLVECFAHFQNVKQTFKFFSPKYKVKVLTLNIAKVTKSWDEMSVESDVPISFYEKKGSAAELIEIFSKGLIEKF